MEEKIPEAAAPQQKAEAILAWKRKGPPGLEVTNPAQLSVRDPEDTLNYRELLEVCGSATKTFLNVARSAGVPARRMTRHVFAELNVDARGVIADATYRVFLKDDRGNLLTQKDLENPEIFCEVTSGLPHYSPEYPDERVAHVRLAALPFHGVGLRPQAGPHSPKWDENTEWSCCWNANPSLCFSFSTTALLFLVVLRLALGWIADKRLWVPRFHLRANLSRATAALFTTPEIK